MMSTALSICSNLIIESVTGERVTVRGRGCYGVVTPGGAPTRKPRAAYEVAGVGSGMSVAEHNPRHGGRGGGGDRGGSSDLVAVHRDGGPERRWRGGGRGGQRARRGPAPASDGHAAQGAVRQRAPGVR